MKGLAKIEPAEVTVKEAKSRTDELRTKATGLLKGTWQLGLMTMKALEDGVPGALDKTATEWMEAWCSEAGISVSKLQRCLRIARALEGVPEKSMAQLTEGAAYELARLPENLRDDPKWVSDAIKLKLDDFAAKVKDEIGGEDQHRDVMVTLSAAIGFSTVPETLLTETIKPAMERARELEERDGDACDLSTKEGALHAFEKIFAEFMLSTQDAASDAPIDIEASVVEDEPVTEAVEDEPAAGDEYL